VTNDWADFKVLKKRFELVSFQGISESASHLLLFAYEFGVSNSSFPWTLADGVLYSQDSFHENFDVYKFKTLRTNLLRYINSKCKIKSKKVAKKQAFKPSYVK
jgi:hypothetical protein